MSISIKVTLGTCTYRSVTFLAEVVIGFRPDVYTVSELEGSVTLTVEVISGQLDREVTVSFATRQDTATSMYTVS